MNVVDLHPEDLIDKLEGGSLSAEEKARLEAHLRGCVECRFEITLRADLADEALAPRARPAPPAAPLAAPRSAPRSVAPRRSLPRRALLFPAIAAALVAGGALAAVVSEAVRARIDGPSLHRLESSRVEGRATLTGVGSRVQVAAAAPQAVAASPQAAAAIAPTKPADVEENHDVAPLPPTPARGATSPASTRRTNPIQQSATTEGEPRTAAGLFGAANRARRYGDTAQAVALYRSLQARFPGSDEAQLSRATLATLELDRGDPAAALDGFDRYLEQGGSTLGVEALIGRAIALENLGKGSEALASWKEIARRFPGTVHAKRAAVRIAVLSDR